MHIVWCCAISMNCFKIPYSGFTYTIMRAMDVPKTDTYAISVKIINLALCKGYGPPHVE